jgi:hypothetical protein
VRGAQFLKAHDLQGAGWFNVIPELSIVQWFQKLPKTVLRSFLLLQQLKLRAGSGCMMMMMAVAGSGGDGGGKRGKECWSGVRQQMKDGDWLTLTCMTAAQNGPTRWLRFAEAVYSTMSRKSVACIAIFSCHANCVIWDTRSRNGNERCRD